MSQLKGVFSWRLLYVAALLALLSLLAPLGWQRLEEGSGFRVQGSGAKSNVPSPRSKVAATPLTTHHSPLTPQPSPQSAIRNPQFAPQAAPHIAPLGPLVADHIDLDPSLTHVPSLPRPKIEYAPAALPALPDSAYTRQDPPAGDEPASPPAVLPEPARPAELPPPKAWPLAAGLIEQLHDLAAELPPAAEWAREATAELEALAQLDSLADAAAAARFAQLNRLADAGKELAETLPYEADRSKVLRAGYSIVRRIVVWELVHELAKGGQAELAPVVDSRAAENALVEVERRLAATGDAGPWRVYLKIDEAREKFDSRECLPSEQRELARDILHRLHSTQLSRPQEQFLALSPFVAWREQLLARAAETPDLTETLLVIERQELAPDLSEHARELAAVYDRLRWSPDDGICELAETINTYYRNANVRVALTAELVNRMLPKAQQMYEPVNDTIQEARVQGESLTTTKVRLVLVPDPQRWNIGLEANGEVASATTSTKGPATFRQDSVSLFRIRKRVTVDRRGIRLQSAEGAASANNNLSDYATEFDGIPLFGSLARAIARNQYESTQPAARQEVEGKIVWRASSELDRQVAARLEKAKRDLQTRLLDPLAKLDLEPTAVDMETTSERLIARFRVAGRDQISAHTPRPQAPGDSILSVQIHETALNNVLDHLNLHGKRIELRELYKDMATRFSQEKVQVPEDLPEDVYVTFADEDPVRVDCRDGQVRLQIRLKELVQEGTDNRWTNFTVRAYYQPDAEQRDANLVRVPNVPIELIGRGINVPDRITLSGIFGKVLSRNRKLNLINKQIAQAPELSDQQVTQFVIHDGWIGVALGPQAPGRAAFLHPRPPIRIRTE